MSQLDTRTTAEVFEDHLRRAAERDLEGDLRKNYDPGCVILTTSGVYHGHDGVRQRCQLLYRRLPAARWRYCVRHVDGKFAFLEWTARDDGAMIEDGADSFVVENGKIIAQTGPLHRALRRRPN